MSTAVRLVEAAPSTSLKLDLACGQNPKEGFEGVDLYGDKAAHKVDLLKFPWPWADASVDELHCVPGDQFVTTPQGLKRIETIRSGDLVLGISGWTRVRRVFARLYDGLAYRLTTSTGVVEVTKEHPVATPHGWVKADKLRQGFSVLKHTAQVELPHRVDVGDIARIVRRFPALAAGGSVHVVEVDSSSAEPLHDLHLSDLANKKRLNRTKHAEHVLEAGNGYSGSGFPARRRQLSRDVARKRNAERRDCLSDALGDGRVRVDYDDLDLNLRSLRDVETDRTFAVDDTGQPSEVSPVRLQNVEPFVYEGVVYNFVTEDSTFFVGSVLTHNCSHFLEHVPAREVEARDLRDAGVPRYADQFLGQDMLFAVMDEAWRVLKPDAWMTIIVPSGRSNRAFWDPTHRRFFMQETFLYFAAEWRKMNGLQHYRVDCNFGVDVGHSVPQEETLRSADAQADRFQHCWNVTYDWIAKLKKLPR